MASPHQPAVTVAICTLNRTAELTECLQRVTALDYPQYEVLVVDNGSEGSTLETARRFGARYVRSAVPGLSRARNDAARNCNTEIIAYIDDDAIPERHWLSALVGEFQDPEVLAVAGHIEASNDPPLRGRKEVFKVDQSTPDWFSITNFGGLGDGGNMAFRMSAFSRWPGFDERLGLGTLIGSGEEHRAFFSIVALGGRCAAAPEAVVRHRDTWTERRVRNFEIAIAYSVLIFREEPKWRGLWLKHAAKHLFSSRRSWRDNRALPVQEALTLPEKLRCLVAGLRLYSQVAKIDRSVTPLLQATPVTTAT